MRFYADDILSLLHQLKENNNARGSGFEKEEQSRLWMDKLHRAKLHA